MNKQFFFLALSRILQVLLSFVTLKMSLYFFNPKEMGEFYLLTSAITFVCFSFLGPIGQFSNRMVHEWKEKNILKNSMIKMILTFLGICAIYASFALVLKESIGDFEKIGNITFVFIIFLGAVANSLVGLVPGLLNILGHYTYFAISTVFSIFLILLLSVSFCFFIYSSPLNWLLGKIVAQGIVAFFATLYFLHLLKSRKGECDNRSFFTDLYNFSAPLFLTSVFMWSQSEGYRFVIGSRIGLEFLGLLLVGLSMATRVSSIVETLAQQLVLPNFYKELVNSSKEARGNIWNTMFNNLLPVYLGTAFFIMAISSYMLRVLGTKDYWGIAWIVVFGAMIEFLRMFSNLLSQISHVEKKTKRLLMPSLLSALFVFLGVFYASEAGREFIPLSIVLANFLSTAFLFRAMSKLIVIRVDFLKIVKSIFIFAPMNLIYFLDIQNDDLKISVFLCFLTGLYYLGGQYYFYKVRGNYAC